MTNTDLDNSRNGSGFKDPGDCYRKGGKLIQWVDEACIGIGEPSFDDRVKDFKARGIKYQITRIDDGRRLFIDFEAHKKTEVSNG